MKKIFILIVSALLLGLLFIGCSDIANITSPATVNTDGELYKCATCLQSDSATGWGLQIKEKGKWFMYNEYPGGTWDPNFGVYNYDIHAGSTKHGLNKIGYFWVMSLGGHKYKVRYDLDPTFVAVDKHLAIQNDWPDFTAAPGRDDNMDFDEEFYDEDDVFYIFAHFAVECVGE